ncbi:hypothetical protein B5G43_04390 [Flavonifractor sp. An92]|uniref:V-type ATP synthase subunit E n=1 Tax=Flavonifractor sp. An92 TaxID=1965666 RepID=UPI000B38B473|nr:V-type ATP synthase subunit E [Flavonifractor sp. An92]OUN07576.1 hypothetical protein B5G43_04390 [Flavonifractor sp. An92]
MPELSKKLERFTSILLAEATAENERTLNELKKRHDAALESAEDRVLLEAYEYIHGEVSRIRGEQGRKVSQRLLENKRALSRRREEIADEVFALVRERIAAFTRTPAYRQRLQELLKESLAALPGAEDVVVTLREEDLPLAKDLRAAAGRPITVEAGPIRLGGLIVRSDSLGLRADASFDCAMAGLDGHFARVVGLSLTDDGADPLAAPAKEA